jgi:hypothetical protein
MQFVKKKIVTCQANLEMSCFCGFTEESSKKMGEGSKENVHFDEGPEVRRSARLGTTRPGSPSASPSDSPRHAA